MPCWVTLRPTRRSASFSLTPKRGRGDQYAPSPLVSLGRFPVEQTDPPRMT